ncbi:MAG: hypothetical protein KBE91_01560 [Bacteroidia bacterium]|nr:hypothetical protein [Bacteroidia bacterium]
MAKLGYTWYPKDWGNSESVFELNLSERGLYREFIDLAMLNNNETEIKKEVWVRKFCISITDLDLILDKLVKLNLIQLGENNLFVPSCESRLKLVRGGSNGGKKSKPSIKPIPKPIPKPFESLLENNLKPIPKQREIETKIEIESKVKEIKIEDVKLYFFENGYSEISAQKFFDYYSIANWKDSKGNKVKNWKQKAQAVWFKPENIFDNLKKEYKLYSAQGSTTFFLNEIELKEKKASGYWKELNEM